MYLTLVLLTLATWRVTHLITDDTLPFGTLRMWLEEKSATYGWGLGCTFCMSVWTGWAGAAVGYWVLDLPAQVCWLLAAGALATFTILLEGIVERLMGPE